MKVSKNHRKPQIFVSYPHGDRDRWTPWVTEVFVERLKYYLDLQAGEVTVFADNKIQSGARWEEVLRLELARSKLMLALVSPIYFQRKWCRREMSLMFEREKKLKLVGSGNNYGLIIPVRLGDGEHFPDLIQKIQYHDFEPYTNLDLPAGTLPAWKFNQSISELAKIIAQTLPKAPKECCDSWYHFTGNEFFPRLKAKPYRSAPPRPNI